MHIFFVGRQTKRHLMRFPHPGPARGRKTRDAGFSPLSFLIRLRRVDGKRIKHTVELGNVWRLEEICYTGGKALFVFTSTSKPLTADGNRTRRNAGVSDSIIRTVKSQHNPVLSFLRHLS
ncbi:hypothetical protein F2P81_004072 [Scophthalmus maximus]|uniref:Uncharacterized protein n=1 Tax=Scophthalmus maximus TaxID=52904 RepID=A0A6A4TBW4_SCOMX|nr:hypothetical protein F2P81_004072 [Scophthalmus maximus]